MKARKLLLTSVSSAVLGLSLMSISAPLSDNSNLIYGGNIISNGDFEINGVNIRYQEMLLLEILL